MSAGLTDPAEFTVKVRYPQVLAAVFLSIGAADCPVFIGQRAGVGVAKLLVIVLNGAAEFIVTTQYLAIIPPLGDNIICRSNSNCYPLQVHRVSTGTFLD